ncbi:MAG: 30S ribosomal protein S9 [Armatimonadota bacterium]|nr:MAG: 30S ribosomal protein S9 [Armatimonadota bacterium]
MAERYYGTGRRKDAVAKVWLVSPGQGRITVNSRPIGQYVGRKTLEVLVREPLEVTDTMARFDVKADTTGGGVSGQAGAVRHGIARALVAYDENLRSVLRKSGMLTRDSRIKERKKYGRKRARRGFQWTKR